MWTPQILNEKQQPSKSVVTSFTFRTNFPILVKSIRIWKGAVLTNSPFSVSLKNADTGDEIILVSHTDFKTTSEHDVWMEAQQSPFLIPKSFDFEIQIVKEPRHVKTTSMNSTFPCYGRSLWFNFSGAVEFTTQFGPDRGWTIFEKDSCSPVSLLMDLYGMVMPSSLCLLV